MSEGLEVLGFIHYQGGCMLSDICSELNLPLSSVHGWISLLCSTGYLKRCEAENGSCPCEKSGKRCVSCSCSCKATQVGIPVRIEVTERGMDLFRRNKQKIGKTKIIPDDGKLS
ncbi:MAG TPA: hypothetical protein VN429_11020 [Methanospirillum sp.]|uniref:hypothetical protein n=1 Tax=Methanospirillum sp. TaxID=45200 RepID=UPI002CAA1492|nr:hypothetical protein [Methanospirillum sp.]HWQ64938.1 hypothetical protein [Methanospirillum sp.]